MKKKVSQISQPDRTDLSRLFILDSRDPKIR